MSAAILQFRRKFDPDAAGAEQRYDQTVQRLHWLTVTLRRERNVLEELERQFVQEDLLARSGSRKGEPLTPRGRRVRLQELFDLRDKVRQKDTELSRIEEEYKSIQSDLQAWSEARQDDSSAR